MKNLISMSLLDVEMDEELNGFSILEPVRTRMFNAVFLNLSSNFVHNQMNQLLMNDFFPLIQYKK